MQYPVTLTPDNGGYVVSFPDIPEALTQGDNREEALTMALDALITAFDFYFEDGRPVPAASPVTGDYVEVPLSVVSKVIMLNAFVESRLTQTELASRMGVKKQELTRLFNLHHSTKIDTVQNALAAMGKRLQLSVTG
jgi:antitoxin HicB